MKKNCVVCGKEFEVGNHKATVNTCSEECRKIRQKEKQADFIQCKAFNKTAELIEKYLSKGSQVGIEGAIQTGSYDKEGQKIYTTEVIVNRIEFLSKAEKKEEVAGFQVIDDSDIPF